MALVHNGKLTGFLADHSCIAMDWDANKKMLGRKCERVYFVYSSTRYKKI
jgi:hypothetical protein